MSAADGVDEGDGSPTAGSSATLPRLAEAPSGVARKGSGDEAGEEGTARPHDLISRELLNELSHEHDDDWSDDRRSPHRVLSPMPGVATPSEPRTPEGIKTPTGEGIKTPTTPYYNLPQSAEAHRSHEGLMCIDQWDWKTDAPEFVPGNMKGCGGPSSHHGGGGGGIFGGGGGWSTTGHGHGGSGISPLGRGGGLGNGVLNPAAAAAAAEASMHQMREQYEGMLQTKAEEVREIQSRMHQLEIETAQVRASWEIERRGLIRQVGHYRGVLHRYCIPFDDPHDYYDGQGDASDSWVQHFEPSVPSQWGDAGVASASLGDSGGPAGGGPGGGGDGPGGPQGLSLSRGGIADGLRVGRRGASAPYDGAGGDAPGQQRPVGSTLDSKMQQLSSLLSDRDGQRKQPSPADGAGGGASRRGGEGGTDPRGFQGKGHDGVSGYSGGDITNLLSTAFPHLQVRVKHARPGAQDEAEGGGGYGGAATSEPEARSVEQQLRTLERSVGGFVDDRALKALHALPRQEAIEALVKVDEMVHTQGGQCRNLSSILQSVCRKMEKRTGKGPRLDQDDGAAPGGKPLTSTPGGKGGRTRRARQFDEEGDAFDEDFGEEGRVAAGKAADDTGFLARTTSVESESSMKLNTPAGRRSMTSWADIESGDEDDLRDGVVGGLFTSSPAGATLGRSSPSVGAPGAGRGHGRGARVGSVGVVDEGDEGEPDAPEPWTPRRVEKAAARGFEFRASETRGFELKISMAGLEPPLTEAGMERYCQWLRARFAALAEEHGEDALHSCRGEVDFSHNGMNNDMVWLLLDTLAQSQVHASCFKLYANRISQNGVLAMCEFIRMNDRARPVAEFHLSHNEIDDDAALELMRTLHSQRPRYPPIQRPEGQGDAARLPVWLRLNHNRIRDPEGARRLAEREGITICNAADRTACGVGHCCYRAGSGECPLVHLYSFGVQPHRVPRREVGGQNSQRATPARGGGAGEDASADRERDRDRDRDRRRERKRKDRQREKQDKEGDGGGAGGAGGVIGEGGGAGGTREEAKEEASSASPKPEDSQPVEQREVATNGARSSASGADDAAATAPPAGAGPSGDAAGGEGGGAGGGE